MNRIQQLAFFVALFLCCSCGNNNYNSVDLNAFGLKGAVKAASSPEWFPTDDGNLYFDEEGVLIDSNGWLYRDGKGRIVGYGQPESLKEDWILHFYYNKDGFFEKVVKGEEVLLFEYDSNGRIIKQTATNQKSSFEMFEYYEYTEFDDTGNWLARTWSGDKQQRKITYYTASKTVDSASDASEEFVGKDLPLFDLKGHVKQVKYPQQTDQENGPSYICEFDKEGRLVKGTLKEHQGMLGEGEEIKYIRNEDGKTVAFEVLYEGESMYRFDPVLFDNGKIARVDISVPFSGSLTCTYSYDNLGTVTSGTSEFSGHGYVDESSFEYKYTKYDDEGNWVERVVTVSGEEGESTHTEIRKIIYY